MLTREDRDAVVAGVREHLDAREGARRFHAERIGKGVNPDRCFGDFLARIWQGDQSTLSKVYGVERSKAAMAESSGTIGGYLVPAELKTELYQTVEEEAIVRPRAVVVPMTSRVLQLPLPDVETAQSANVPPYFGGLQLYWTQEAAARTESEPAWKQTELVAWDLSGECRASNAWLADAVPGTDAFLRRLFARAIAWFEDYAFLRGDGVGKPVGFLTTAVANGKTVTRATSTDFKFADAAGMVELLLPGSWPRALWVMHPSVIVKLVALATTTTAVWQGNQTGREKGAGPVGWLHTLPVYVSDKLPALGTAGDVLLIDPGLYVIGDRGVEIAFSAEQTDTFLKNQSVFRILARVAGRPWFDDDVTLADGTKTAYSAIALV